MLTTVLCYLQVALSVRTMGSVSTIIATMSATATVSLASLANGVKLVSTPHALHTLYVLYSKHTSCSQDVRMHAAVRVVYCL